MGLSENGTYPRKTNGKTNGLMQKIVVNQWIWGTLW